MSKHLTGFWCPHCEQQGPDDLVSCALPLGVVVMHMCDTATETECTPIYQSDDKDSP